MSRTWKDQDLGEETQWVLQWESVFAGAVYGISGMVIETINSLFTTVMGLKKLSNHIWPSLDAR